MKGLDIFVTVLLLVGGLNWGLIGFFDYNLAYAVFGETLSRVLYALVGLAALYEVFSFKWIKHRWCAPATYGTTATVRH